MMQQEYFHGGVRGFGPGDLLVPSPPPIVDDNCPICVARREGRIVTVAEYRAWLEQFGEQTAPILKELEGAPDHAPVDPPSTYEAVYITTDRDYARWYASRSRGDLYAVEPIGDMTASAEDLFPSFMVGSARIVRVVERNVRFVRRDRRALTRRLGKLERQRHTLAPV